MRAMSELTYIVDDSTQTFDQAVQEIARRLTEIKLDANNAADSKSWEAATTYVLAYETLEATYKRDYGNAPSPQKINKAIRQAEGYEGFGGSWLNHAKRLYRFCPDVFLLPATRKLSYDNYRLVVTCSLPETKKRDLFQWAEEYCPQRKDLRQRIRDLVDAEKGISRPDFPLKVGNLWTFGHKTQPDGFDGGISPEVVANLLYYCTDSGDIVIDPMAGGDTTYKVTQHYKFFQDEKEGMDFSGPREIYRADLFPQYPGIEQCDIRDGLPWSDGVADFCIFDPPYYKIAEGKYDTFGNTIDEWIDNITLAIHHIKRVLKPGGLVSLITDDYLRSNEFHPLASYMFQAGIDNHLIPARTIYNTYANFVVTMTATEMKRAKVARMLVNQVKVIHVMEKPND